MAGGCISASLIAGDAPIAVRLLSISILLALLPLLASVTGFVHVAAIRVIKGTLMADIMLEAGLATY